jgi:hypothetical protein
MATTRIELHSKSVQAEQLGQVPSKNGDGDELNVVELEERVAPLWKRQYP